MNALFRQLNRFGNPFKMPGLFDLPKWEYQPAAGKPDLVEILEDKYGARVVVCNGAKQAIAASLYSFKQSGVSNVWYDRPYYPGHPSLADSVALPWSSEENAAGRIITSPNNPDGRNLSNDEIAAYKVKGPMIHDGAYYSPIYLPDGQNLVPLGDIQVFSMSKMYGVSGLRIGYAVVYNEKYYQDMVNYIEMSTAGVSTASQDIARNIEVLFKENPSYYKQFVEESRNSIALARKELLNLDPEVLELVQCDCNSMFGWFKAGPALDATTAKVYVLPGELFGAPGMIRMNIAHPASVIKDAVERLNLNKIRS